jgi:oligosaccharide repeat unit polymerase
VNRSLAQTGSRSAASLSIQVYWIAGAVMAISLWSYTELSGWHLAFFAMLAAGLYLSFSRYQLPLMVYFSTVLIYWVVAPMLQQRIGVGYYHIAVSVRDFGPAAFFFTLAHFAGILAGLLLGNASKPRSAQPPNSRFSYFGVGAAITLMFALTYLAGFEVVLSFRVEQDTGDASNYSILARNIAKLLPAALVTYFILGNWRNMPKAYRNFLLLILVALMLLYSNPFNTGRFLSLAGIALVLITYAIQTARKNLLAVALAFAPVYAIFLLSLTTAMRFGFDRLSSTNMLASLQTLEFSAYSVFIDALELKHLPSDNYLLSHLFIVVPRSIWPDKAYSIGIDVADRSGYIFSNVGLIPFFNAYADYGLLGLFGFSLLFGFLANKLNPAKATPTFRNRSFMYGIILTSMMPMLFRGDLGTAMLAIYPAIFAYEFVRLVTSGFGSKNKA